MRRAHAPEAARGWPKGSVVPRRKYLPTNYSPRLNYRDLGEYTPPYTVDSGAWPGETCPEGANERGGKCMRGTTKRAFDLEQPRTERMPIHPAHRQAGYSYLLHRHHEDEYRPEESGPRTGAAGVLVCGEHT